MVTKFNCSYSIAVGLSAKCFQLYYVVMDSFISVIYWKYPRYEMTSVDGLEGTFLSVLCFVLLIES